MRAQTEQPEVIPQLGMVLVAGGAGLRMGGSTPKQFLELLGRPLWRWSLESLLQAAIPAQVVLVVPKGMEIKMRELPAPPEIPDNVRWEVVAGGAQRQDSVLLGVKALDSSITTVAVHDAARPFPPSGATARLLKQAVAGMAGTLAAPCVDSIRRTDNEGQIREPLSREGLWLMQTPQAAPKEALLDALRALHRENRIATDETQALLALGHRVQVVPSDPQNRKVTQPEDWDWALQVARLRSANGPIPTEFPMRIGHGHDVHRLAEGRRLVLGGVEIPHHRGLAGHSDADAAIHALCDALLNALALGDIGTHFSDQDNRWKDADSRDLLHQVVAMVLDRGWRVGNASLVILAEEPKLKPHIPAMRAQIAEVLSVSLDSVGISAGTMEGMGPVGRREAIEVTATVVINRS